MESCTAERFLKDTKDHKMEVIRAEGVNRHLRFRKPGTICYGFDIITWPGHLCITGDCGTYVFRRLEDMFQFFRSDIVMDDGFRINPGYWAEKVLAKDVRHGIKRFSIERFAENVRTYFEDSEVFEKEGFAGECWKQIEKQMLNCVSSEFEAYEAIQCFECDGFRFEDFWEFDSQEFDFGFLWNLYAIVWGIREFDNAEKHLDKPNRHCVIHAEIPVDRFNAE